jgi:D-amino peptidase
VQGIDTTFDAVIFIGYRASEGQPGAVLALTFTGSMAVSLNGTAVPEAGFNAAIAGDFGVPVVFLAGDQVIGARPGAFWSPSKPSSSHQLPTTNYQLPSTPPHQTPH